MWRRAVFSRVLMLIAIALPGSTTASAQMEPGERGHVLAQKLCARCHAIGRQGPSPMGLAPPFRELSQRYPVEMLAEALAEGIMTGHPAMPNFTFEPRDINALLTYINGLAPPFKKGKRDR